MKDFGWAVLIGVCIIVIGAGIYSSANSVTNNAAEQIDTIALQMFNQAFTQYAEDGTAVSGTRAQMLANMVVQTEGVDFGRGSLTNEDSFEPTEKYFVTYDYDKNSYIDTVTIKAQN